MKKIISFSLWGTDPKYINGALINLDLSLYIYPGWICRYYVDDSISIRFIQELESRGAEIIKKQGFSDGYEGLFWRFEPAFDPTVERFIVRDCDSRLNICEADAVQEWVESGLCFHCMRDHKGHDIPVLGAMWGAKPFFILEFETLYRDFLRIVSNGPIVKRARYFYTDQLFLNQISWPKIKDKALVHDDLRRFAGNERKFRINLPPGEFIGQQWGMDNQPLLVPV